MPVAIIVVLLLYQILVRRVLPAWSFFLLAAISAYGVAATHDWFALNRARLEAIAVLRDKGVPPVHIQGGFDFDGWTQLENARSMNWSAIENPPNVYRPNRLDTDVAAPCRLDFAAYTPAITPQYFIVFKPMPCLASSEFGPISYGNWLPPHRRFIFIQRKDP
jgi:hypothetical protein